MKTNCTDPHSILFDQVGQGASRATALQDRLPGGMSSSIKMAQADENRTLAHKDKFVEQLHATTYRLHCWPPLRAAKPEVAAIWVKMDSAFMVEIKASA